MIAEVDSNGNGYCEYDEFLYLMSKKINEGQMDEEMTEACKIEIKEDCRDVLESVDTFEEMGLKEEVLRGIYEHGFYKPSPLQK